jgi:hypothetical protein
MEQNSESLLNEEKKEFFNKVVSPAFDMIKNDLRSKSVRIKIDSRAEDSRTLKVFENKKEISLYSFRLNVRFKDETWCLKSTGGRWRTGKRYSYEN